MKRSGSLAGLVSVGVTPHKQSRTNFEVKPFRKLLPFWEGLDNVCLRPFDISDTGYLGMRKVLLEIQVFKKIRIAFAGRLFFRCIILRFILLNLMPGSLASKPILISPRELRLITTKLWLGGFV